MRKRWIASSYSANAMLEESLVEARHHVQQGVLGTAHPDPIHYLQDAQRLCFPVIAAVRHCWWLLCFRFIASLRESHRDLVFVPEISEFFASSTRKLWSYGNHFTTGGPISVVSHKGMHCQTRVANLNFGFMGEKFGRSLRRTKWTW